MPIDTDNLRAALRKVVDPEVGINIVDLGLVYAITQDEHGVTVDLTMTSPACPMGEGIVAEAEYELAAILPADMAVVVNLVWDPPWSPALMSDQARNTLGWEK
ncbi:MAG: metal-sulfur cluster assembly factor [Betaproteobacteria bacterium]